jgi:hypothetical protein
MTRKANTGSRGMNSNSNRQRSVKARGSRIQKRTLTGGVKNSDVYGGFAQQNSGSQTPMPIQQKQPSRWNTTKKFFGGLKQKFSNKMSGVSKFILENREGNVNGQSNLHYFVLAENETLYSKIKGLDNKDNISHVKQEQVNNILYNKLKNKGLLAQIVKDDANYKFDNTVIDQKTPPGKVRIFTYYISKALHSTSQLSPTHSPVSVNVKQNNNKGLGDENAILFTAKDSTGKDIHFKYRKVTQASEINNIVVNINKSLSDSNRLCSWDDIKHVIMNSNHEQKTNDIITKISSLQNAKKLVYIYNDNGFIKYTKETETGTSNNQNVESTILPTTVKYVVYAYKAGEGIYNTPHGISNYEEAGYMTIDEMRAGKQPNKQKEATYLQVEPSGDPTSRQTKTSTKVNHAPQVIGAPPTRQARQARLAALAAAKPMNYRLQPANNSGLQFNNPQPGATAESIL